MNSRQILGCALAALSLLLSACGGSGGGGGDGTSKTTTTVGAAGGTVTGPDGMRVEIPAGALDGNVEIGVKLSSTGAPALPGDANPASAVYEFTPHGIAFNKPVTISLPSTEDPTVKPIMMAEQGEAGWTTVNATLAAGRVTWQVMGFSWGIGPVDCAIPNNDPDPDPHPCVVARSLAVLAAQPAPALTQTGYGSIESYRLSAEATVSLTFRYTVAADCWNPTAKIVRYRPDVKGANGRPIETVLLDNGVPLTTLSPNGHSITGEVTLSGINFTYAERAQHFFRMNMQCNRTYRNRLQGSGGQVLIDTSAMAELAITQQPTNQTVAPGATATFSVSATGTPAPSLQWQVSTDGGATWTDIPGATGTSYTTPATTSGDNGSRYRVVATNANGTATSTPATLTVSAAANCTGPGNTGWCRTASASALTGVSFGSSQVGLVHRYGSGGEVLLTTDGGVTWTTGISFMNTYRAYISGAAFADANTVIAVGSNADTQDHLIYRSTDAGQTWTQVYSEPFATLGAWLQSPVFLDANVGLVAAGQYVLRTADGGLTWNRITHGQAESVSRLASLGGSNVVGAAFVSGGNSGRMLRSADGGLTWTAGSALTGWLQYLGAMSFMNANTGIARIGASSGQTYLARTTDGGVTWALLTLTTTTGSYLDAAVLSSDGTGVVTTGNGEMLRTADGGATWQAVNSGTTQPLRAGASPAAGVFVLVGDGGVLRNTEGGNGP